MHSHLLLAADGCVALDPGHRALDPLGLGPGDPELLTLKAHRILTNCPVVAYPAPDTGESFARRIVSAFLTPDQLEIPIIVPMVIAQGYDVIWFGILMIVLIEMALITPPVGLNLYVVQGARKSGSLNEVMLGALPYVLVMLAMAFLLIWQPDIALWLPRFLQ